MPLLCVFFPNLFIVYFFFKVMLSKRHCEMKRALNAKDLHDKDDSKDTILDEEIAQHLHQPAIINEICLKTQSIELKRIIEPRMLALQDHSYSCVVNLFYKK